LGSLQNLAPAADNRLRLSNRNIAAEQETSVSWLPLTPPARLGRSTWWAAEEDSEADREGCWRPATEPERAPMVRLAEWTVFESSSVGHW
jgi:hypothetical protein